jgi:hypothetical protein
MAWTGKMAERETMPIVVGSREMLTVTCVRLMEVRVAMGVMVGMGVMAVR